MNSQDLISTKEAASILNVSERTVQRWIRSGKIRAVKKLVARPQGGGRKTWCIPFDNQNDTKATETNHFDNQNDTKATETNHSDNQNDTKATETNHFDNQNDTKATETNHSDNQNDTKATETNHSDNQNDTKATETNHSDNQNDTKATETNHSDNQNDTKATETNHSDNQNDTKDTTKDNGNRIEDIEDNHRQKGNFQYPIDIKGFLQGNVKDKNKKKDCRKMTNGNENETLPQMAKSKRKQAVKHKMALSDVWLDAAMISKLTGLSDRTVRHHCQTGKYRAKKEKNTYLISLSSVGDEYVRKYWARKIREDADCKLPVIDNPEAVGFSGKPTAKDKVAIIECYNSLKGKVKTEILIEILNGEYKELQLTRTKLFRWQKQFKEKGIDGLKDKRGGNNVKTDMEILREVLMAHTAALTDFNLFEIYKLRWKQKHNLEYDNITYTGFVRAKKKLLKEDIAVRIMHTKGLDSLFSTVATVRRRDITRINQEWQIDATKCDVMVLSPEIITSSDPEFKNAIPYRKWYEYKFGQDLEWGLWMDEYRVIYRPRRKQIIAIIDVYSGRRVWGLYDSSSSYSDVRLLKKAILKLGKPHVLRMDNGSDYVSLHFQQALANLGIIKRFARPYKGKDKGSIERNFRTILHGKLELLEGFLGHNVASRQIVESSVVTKDERLNGVKTHLKSLFTEEEMELILDRFIELEEERLGCIERWELQAQKNPELIEEIPEEIINISIGKRYIRKVQKTGISLNKAEYQHPDFYKYVGTEVIVCENIDDISRVYVLDKEENFLFEAFDSRVRSFTVEEARKMEKQHTAIYKKLRKTAQKVRKEDNELVRKEFITDVLNKERERKKEILTVQKDGNAEDKTKKSEINPLLWEKVLQFNRAVNQ